MILIILNNKLNDSLRKYAKLKRQKRILLEQVKNGYEVDYRNEVMTKALRLTNGE